MRGFLFAAVVFSSLSSVAQGPAATTVALPPGPLLPQTFGVWKQVEAPAVPACDADNSCGEDKEYGLQRSAAAVYARTDGRSTKLTVRADDMADATGAYSAFTLQRGGMRECSADAKLGHGCALAPGRLLFWEGETLVEVKAVGSDPIRLPDLKPLVDVLPKPKGGKSALPTIPNWLPLEGLDRLSVRYVIGPATYVHVSMPVPAALVGFDKSAEAVLAKYRGKGGAGSLAIFYYPTNQIAGDRERAMTAALQGQVVALRRIKNTLSVAYGGFTQAQAQAMVASVKDRTQVSFQDGGLLQPAEPIQTSVTILTKIIFFVFFMTLAAAVLGIFFGGGRAMIRKMRGKPLSSLEDMEFIKLEIGGKPGTKLPEDGTKPGAV